MELGLLMLETEVGPTRDKCVVPGPDDSFSKKKLHCSNTRVVKIVEGIEDLPSV